MATRGFHLASDGPTRAASRRPRPLGVALASALLLGSLLSGCGGSGPSTSSTASSLSVPSSPAAAPTPGGTSTHTSSANAGAVVAGTPIPKTGYEHWVSVEKALGAHRSPSHQALGFLITSEWVLREAAARHITVTEAEVKQRFAELVHKTFPKPGELQKYLAKSGETEADLLARIKVELLSGEIAAQVTAGKRGARRAAALRRFEKQFQKHWKALTNCKAGYVMEDCKQYKGKPEDLAASTPAPSTTNAASSSNGEVYSPPGGFSITSPEFERNGPIPAEYTCAGTGISPALSWEKVPSGAAELFLFVIDLNNSGPEGGQRWVVGGIDPHSTGVAAGQLPPGAIVGTNTAGKAAYSAICPAKGKSDTVEFVMYALSKKISLTPGFQPSAAEAQYGSGKLLMGQAAITYGIASR
jgi:phosphatidylethanolamine-binding protein (PEBP) family uncharacterized protein